MNDRTGRKPDRRKSMAPSRLESNWVISMAMHHDVNLLHQIYKLLETYYKASKPETNMLAVSVTQHSQSQPTLVVDIKRIRIKFTTSRNILLKENRKDYSAQVSMSGILVFTLTIEIYRKVWFPLLVHQLKTTRSCCLSQWS